MPNQILLNPSVPLTNMVQRTDRELDPTSSDGYGPPHFIYQPQSPWSVRNAATVPGTEQPNLADVGRYNSLLPQAEKTVVEASNRTSILTFTQRTTITANTRYLNKVTLDTSHLTWMDANPEGWRTSVQARQNYYVGGNRIIGRWHPVAWEEEAIALQVAQANAAGTIDVEVELWIVWPAVVGSFTITGFTMEVVSDTYGNDNPSQVVQLGTPNGDPEPEPDTSFDWQVVAVALGLAFAAVLVVVGVFVVHWLTNQNPSMIGEQAMPIYQLTEVNTAAEMILAVLVSIAVGGVATLAATPIINLVKLVLQRVGLENQISGDLIKTIVGVLITVVYWALRWRGVSVEQFGQWDNLVGSTVNVLVSWMAIVWGSGALHSFAVNHKNAPKVYSYQRSKPDKAA